MFAGVLIVILICVVFLGAFSVQNTGPVDVRFFNLIVASTPVYVLVIISAALGAVITTLVAAWSRARQSLRGRPVRRKAVEQEKAVGDLTGKVSGLEAERARLVANGDLLGTERDDLRSHVAELQNGLGSSRPFSWAVGQAAIRRGRPVGRPGQDCKPGTAAPVSLFHRRQPNLAAKRCKEQVGPAGNGLVQTPRVADPGAESSKVVPEVLALRTEEPAKKEFARLVVQAQERTVMFDSIIKP